MMRTASALACLALLLVGCSRSAPGYQPEPRKAIDPVKIDPADRTNLFPLREGSQWVYTLELNRVANGRVTFSGTGEVIYRVAKSETRGDQVRATLELVQGDRVVDRQVWLATSKGIFQASVMIDGRDVFFSPNPQPVVLNPAEDGKTFKWSGRGVAPSGQVGQMEASGTIETNKEVDTEIDRFNAVSVRTRTTFRANNQRGTAEGTIWLTPGVGLVRYYQETQSGGTGNIVTLKLKSFSLK